MTSIPANLPHRHVDHETGHILHVDPITGDIIARKEMTRRKGSEAQYQTWAAHRRADANLTKDHATAQASLSKIAPAVEAVTPTTKRNRGRPKTIIKNPAAAYIPFLIGPAVEQLACMGDNQDEEDNDHIAAQAWVDDIIHGSILTSAKTSNGKINVKARAVIRALFLWEISAEACQTCEYTLRTAQRIAKAARHAAHGIALYVERHHKLKEALEAKFEAEALSWASQA